MYVFISEVQMLDLSVKQLLVIPLLVESSTSFQPSPAWIGMSPQGLKGRHTPLILNRENEGRIEETRKKKGQC